MNNNCKNCMDHSYTKNLFGKVISLCHATGEEKEDLSIGCNLWRHNPKPFLIKDYEKLLHEVIFDKSTSDFTRDSIAALEQKDIVDILNDLEVLQSIYSLKLETMLRADGYILFKNMKN